jgi:chromosome segregation ATPase
MAAPHPSMPDLLTAMQKEIADLQAGRLDDRVKMVTQQGRIEALHAQVETLHANIETLHANIEDLQADSRVRNTKILQQSRTIEKLMKSHRRAQTLTSRQMLEKYRVQLLEAARREATDVIPVLIERVRDDPNTSAFDRWVLNEYASVSKQIHGEHSKHEAREVAETRGGMYSELYRRLYASD